MAPAGIEPATFRFVVQHLNHCATAVPNKNYKITKLLGEEARERERIKIESTKKPERTKKNMQNCKACKETVQFISIQGGRKVQLHSILPSSLDGGEWSASNVRRFTPQKGTPVPTQQTGLVLTVF